MKNSSTPFLFLRSQYNFTPTDIAESSGLDLAYISKIEDGSIDIGDVPLRTAIRIADALNIIDVRHLMSNPYNAAVGEKLPEAKTVGEALQIELRSCLHAHGYKGLSATAQESIFSVIERNQIDSSEFPFVTTANLYCSIENELLKKHNIPRYDNDGLPSDEYLVFCQMLMDVSYGLTLN